MSARHIKSHSFKAHRTAATAVADAIRKMDEDIRALHRRQDLFPAEQDRRIAEAKAAGTAKVRQAQATLRAAIAEDRQESRYADAAPSADEAARRTYYATAAMAELAGLGNRDEVLATVKRVVDSGDHERAREYIRAAGGRADASALTAMERLVEPPEARMHRSFAAAVDTMEYEAARFDAYVEQHLARAGVISDDVKQGLAPEEPLSTRQLSLWLDALPERTGAAFNAHEDAEAGARQRAERGDFINLRVAGTEGWDATDHHSADQSTGGPQAQADAPGDASTVGSDA